MKAKTQDAMKVECIGLGVRVDCISFDYTSSTMLPSGMRAHKRDGISQSIQKRDKVPGTRGEVDEKLKNGVALVEQRSSCTCAAPSTLQGDSTCL